MDDLLQSLVATGKGPHTLARPDPEASAEEGAAFGATFDALLIGGSARFPDLRNPANAPIVISSDETATEAATPDIAFPVVNAAEPIADGPLPRPEADGAPEVAPLLLVDPPRKHASGPQAVIAQASVPKGGTAAPPPDVAPSIMTRTTSDPLSPDWSRPAALAASPGASAPGTPPGQRGGREGRMPEWLPRHQPQGAETPRTPHMVRATVATGAGNAPGFFPKEQAEGAQPAAATARLSVPPSDGDQAPRPVFGAEARGAQPQPLAPTPATVPARALNENGPPVTPRAVSSRQQGRPGEAPSMPVPDTPRRPDVGPVSAAPPAPAPVQEIGATLPPRTRNLGKPSRPSPPLRPGPDTGVAPPATAFGGEAPRNAQVTSVPPPGRGRAPSSVELPAEASALAGAARRNPAAGSVASTSFTTVAPPSPPRVATATDAPPRDIPAPRVGGWTLPASPSASPYVLAPMLPAAASAPPPPTPLLNLAEIAADAVPDLDANLQTMLGAGTAVTLSAPGSVLAQASLATAQVVAQQLAAALSSGNIDTDSPLELALDPPELGRVRMMMSEVAGVLTLTIHAERPETADLMRRHLDLLAQEFAQAGLDAPSVHISQQGADTAQGDDRGSATPTASADDATALEEPHDQHADRAATGGLDLRL
jgi:hypothetical protein